LSVFPEIYQDALGLVLLEYSEVNFPEVWPYTQDIDDVLSSQVWED
jgi:hypothetical protein